MPARQIYLSLGSNIGNRAANIERAIAALDEADVRVRRVSSLYQTEPKDFPAQHWFLNCLVEAKTNLPPLPLLDALRRIEFQMGSRKLVAQGPRRIDLDILLYGRATIQLPELQIPHPRMHLRRFVLAPLAEIAPALSHSDWGDTVAGLLAKTPDCGQVRKVATAP